MCYHCRVQTHLILGHFRAWSRHWRIQKYHCLLSWRVHSFWGLVSWISFRRKFYIDTSLTISWRCLTLRLTATLGFNTIVSLLLAAPPWVLATMISCSNAWHAGMWEFLSVSAIPYDSAQIELESVISTWRYGGGLPSLDILSASLRCLLPVDMRRCSWWHRDSQVSCLLAVIYCFLTFMSLQLIPLFSYGSPMLFLVHQPSAPLLSVLWMAWEALVFCEFYNLCVVTPSACLTTLTYHHNRIGSFAWKSEWGPDYHPSMYIGVATLLFASFLGLSE